MKLLTSGTDTASLVKVLRTLPQDPDALVWIDYDTGAKVLTYGTGRTTVGHLGDDHGGSLSASYDPKTKLLSITSDDGATELSLLHLADGVRVTFSPADAALGSRSSYSRKIAAKTEPAAMAEVERQLRALPHTAIAGLRIVYEKSERSLWIETSDAFSLTINDVTKQSVEISFDEQAKVLRLIVGDNVDVSLSAEEGIFVRIIDVEVLSKVRVPRLVPTPSFSRKIAAKTAGDPLPDVERQLRGLPHDENGKLSVTLDKPGGSLWIDPPGYLGLFVNYVAKQAVKLVLDDKIKMLRVSIGDNVDVGFPAKDGVGVRIVTDAVLSATVPAAIKAIYSRKIAANSSVDPVAEVERQLRELPNKKDGQLMVQFAKPQGNLWIGTPDAKIITVDDVTRQPVKVRYDHSADALRVGIGDHVDVNLDASGGIQVAIDVGEVLSYSAKIKIAELTSSGAKTQKRRASRRQVQGRCCAS